ncbi:MAG: SDR family NAD(P)-dependent oxidoreductase [Bacteroidales bacterium]|nr:SDR family NAD(P)-dependent oxidoreductase [Bacteroidales bacterium]
MKEAVHSDVSGMALITGASSGIGYEYSKLLARMGYNLLLVSNESDRLQAVRVELQQYYHINADACYMDLAHSDAASRLYDYCTEHGYVIDILINNAGIFSFREVVTDTPERLQTMLNLHVSTPSLLCYYFGKDMKERRSGYILNMSSLSAWLPFPGITMYAATKAYLKIFSASFRLEMKPYNVGVTTVAPGAVATDLYHLKKSYQRLGVRLGIILPPEKLVKSALRGMFRYKKVVCPGIVNRLFLLLFPLLPERVILYIKKKISKYES